MPMSTPKSSRFRSPALKSSQFRPPTQQPIYFCAYTEVKSRSTAHAVIKSSTSTRSLIRCVNSLEPKGFRPECKIQDNLDHSHKTWVNRSQINSTHTYKHAKFDPSQWDISPFRLSTRKPRQFRCSLVNQAIIGLHRTSTRNSILSARTKTKSTDPCTMSITFLARR